MRLLCCTLALAVVPAAGVFADVVVITADRTVGAEDLSLDGQDVIVRGSTVTIDGAHTLASLRLERNPAAPQTPGLITHTPGAVHGGVSGVDLMVLGDLWVQGPDEGGATRSGFNVAGRGYAPHEGPSPAVDTVGAGHAGYGYRSDRVTAGLPYGDIEHPRDHGSGGVGPNARGGGAVHLRVLGALTHQGVINAQGFENGGVSGGGSSGGSIWIEAGRWSGAGTLVASGAHGGSAGRVAVTVAQGPGPESFQLYSDRGGHGTALVRAGGGAPRLFVVGRGTAGHPDDGATPIPGLVVADLQARHGVNIELAGGFRSLGAAVVDDFSFLTVVGDVRVGSLAVGGFGVSDVSGMTVRPVDLTVWPLVRVDGDASISGPYGLDARGCGYPSDQGPGAGAPLGTFGAGAGHGGAGGSAQTANAAVLSPGGPTYGDCLDPVTPGSGGGHAEIQGRVAPGGTGGGAVRFDVGGTLRLDSWITVDGGPARTDSQGRVSSAGGSGGSINIRCHRLEGAGAIMARGGAASALDGPSRSASGGGGRIAIRTDEWAHTGDISAAGIDELVPRTVRNGGAGSIYTQVAGGTPTLRYDNGGGAGAASTLQERLDFAGLLRVGGGAVLAAPAMRRLEIRARAGITVEPAGAIVMDGLGEGPASGPGAGVNGRPASGGGHGGRGGSTSAAPGGRAYDSVITPALAGSGGGRGQSNLPAGSGGGAVSLETDGILRVDGPVTANGTAGAALSGTTHSGGGAGGSVLAVARRLEGSGVIAADGGAGAVSGGVPHAGGGGGGRIAIHTRECVPAPRRALLSVRGGAGVAPGEAGSIFIRGFPDLNGDGAVDDLDYRFFVDRFASGGDWADFDGDGFIDMFDYLAFLDAMADACAGLPS